MNRLTEGALIVSSSLEIDGAGKVTITGDAKGNDITRLGDITDVDASTAGENLLSDNSRIIEAGSVGGSGGSVVLTGLTLTGGNSFDENQGARDGGAISGFGFNIQVRNTTLAGNTAAETKDSSLGIGSGGAIETDRSVELVNTILIDNGRPARGGRSAPRT